MPTRDEVKAALHCMSEGWQMQTNYLDSATKFIYKAGTVAEIGEYCAKYSVELNYALHRWYNFNCARVHEEIFIGLGAIKESDSYHKTVDFRLLGVPFDLKTTYFPKAITSRVNYDLTTRAGKNNLISWLYANQSKQGRFHLENRLFIVCETLASKSDFETIEKRAKQFVDFSKKHGFNEISVKNKPVYSDIIWVPAL